jgi:gamma-glutamyltranspeptidase/glutathione hydrolase
MTLIHQPIVMSDAGIVVSGHHKASDAGAEVLRRGGNAIDAAVAASAVLCVVIPHMSGLGGDCFALYYEAHSERVTAINGSGAAPMKANRSFYTAAGYTAIPMRGPLSLSVCGLVHAWQASLEKFGTLSLAKALIPAIGIAETGVPTDLNLQAFFSGGIYRDLAAEFPALVQVYGPPGPRWLGQRIRQDALAKSLRQLASVGSSALYGGDLGKALVADLDHAGALLSLDDLAIHATRFDTSLSVEFRGAKVHVAPPNSQGLALALLLGLWEELSGQTESHASLSPEQYLRLKQISFHFRDQYVTDPTRSALPSNLLEKTSLQKLLGSDEVPFTKARTVGGDTTTLVVIDRWGNAVSWVQSLFEEFGSGVLSPSTGIVMHDRLYLEKLGDDPVHGLSPGLRPFHTLCPALVIRDGCELAIATPGDHGQSQSLFQVLVNIYDRGLNIQQAIEAPRVRHDEGSTVMIEDRIPAEWVPSIQNAGYDVQRVGSWSRLMGGVNAISRHADGLLMAGADPRRACYATSV